MATSFAPVTPSPQQPFARWNTLQWLRKSRLAILTLDALLLVAVIVGTQIHRDAIRTVGKDTAPSIIAAQRMKADFADMDATLAEDLLVPANTASPEPGVYEQRRIEASEALLSAARNITYKKEEAPIEELQVISGTYERLGQEARDLQDDNQSEMAMRFYRAAGIVMDGTVLPAADALDQANNDALDQTYNSEALRSIFSRSLLALFGLLTLAALLGTQVFLSRRTRRTLNPLLLIATLLTLGLTFQAFFAMTSEEHQLKIARNDSFASIHALLRARAIGYQARTDESRFLVDPAHAAEAQQDFIAKSNALAHIPRGISTAQLLAGEASGAHVNGFTGLLADELNNITFPGEREAALRTLASYEEFLQKDSELRQHEQAHDHADAVASAIGTLPGDAAGAFARFDAALGETLAINQREFDQAVDQGLQALGTRDVRAAFGSLEIEACLIAIAIAALTFLGLAPRIREYV